MRILQRYFWREMVQNFAGVTLALGAILIIYQLGAVLARAAELQYPRGLVLQLFALGAAENFAILLPLGLLLGVVLAVGRMYHENEMVAAQACGFGRAHIYVPLLALALPVAALSAWMNLQLAPAAASQRAELSAQALRAGLAVPFEVGRFRSFDAGRTVVYARSAAPDGELRSVFIKQTAGAEVIATVAQRARREVGSDGLSQTIVLYEGERLNGVPGEQKFRRLRFQSLSIPLAAPELAAHRARLDERPTAQLFGSSERPARAELQWRLGLPLMVLVGAACALPLGRLRPRQGRYAKVWQAVVLFAVYGNLTTAARTWYEHGTTPAPLGLWWVHALFVALAAWLTLGGTAWFRRRRA